MDVHKLNQQHKKVDRLIRNLVDEQMLQNNPKLRRSVLKKQRGKTQKAIETMNGVFYKGFREALVSRDILPGAIKAIESADFRKQLLEAKAKSLVEAKAKAQIKKH